MSGTGACDSSGNESKTGLVSTSIHSQSKNMVSHGNGINCQYTPAWNTEQHELLCLAQPKQTEAFHKNYFMSLLTQGHILYQQHYHHGGKLRN